MKRNDETCLHKHLGATVTLSGSAVHRHGLPVTGELQSDVLLHELLDHLLEDTEVKQLELNYTLKMISKEQIRQMYLTKSFYS